MSMSAFARGWFTAAVVVWMAMAGAQAQDVAPVNSGANPYRVIRDWDSLPWRKGRGAGPTAWRSTRMASPCGRPTVARRERHPAVSAPRQTQSTISTSRVRRSRASRRHVRVAAWHPCRSRRHVWVTDASVTSPDDLKTFPGEEPKEVLPSSSVPTARC